MVGRQAVSEGMLWCLECHSTLDSTTATTGQPVSLALIDAFHARAARIRLHWFAGFVTEYPDPIDEDTRAASLNVETGLVVLHATTGVVHRFEDGLEKDADGFAIFRERPMDVQVKVCRAMSSGPGLPVEERFDYVAVVPAAGGELNWHARSRAEDGQSTNERPLVGRSPRVRFESAGVLKGGGRLSALCDVTRPAVLATRVVLAASETDAPPVPSRFISIRASSMHSAWGTSSTSRVRHVAGSAYP